MFIYLYTNLSIILGCLNPKTPKRRKGRAKFILETSNDPREGFFMVRIHKCHEKFNFLTLKI